MNNDRFYTGDDLKFQITLTAEGFDQTSCNYNIDLYCGKNVQHFDQDDVKEGADGKFYLPIPKTKLSPGLMKMVITAHVPDDDFADGIRDEVEVINLGTIKSIIF